MPPSPFGSSTFGGSAFPGGSLLDKFQGRPTGEIRFPTAPAKPRPAVDPDYLRKARENDPWPEGSSCAPENPSAAFVPPAPTVVLSNTQEAIQQESGFAKNIIGVKFPHKARPVFNTTEDKFWGPTIAINDTWAYDVGIQNYTPSADGTYTAELRVILYDHFGLDVPDLDISLWKPFKPYGLVGLFRAWFILQHVRGYRPFVTVIDTIHPIEGRFR